MSPKSVVAAIEDIDKELNIKEATKLLEAKVFGYSIVNSASSEGEEELKVGIPINCMLARPAHNVEEIKKMLKKFSNEIIAEIKYDGERAQVM